MSVGFELLKTFCRCYHGLLSVITSVARDLHSFSEVVITSVARDLQFFV